MNKSILSSVLLFGLLQLGAAYILGSTLGKNISVQPVVYTQSGSESSLGAINNSLSTITNPFNFTQGLSLGSSTRSTLLTNNSIVLGSSGYTTSSAATTTIYAGKLCIVAQGPAGGAPIYYTISTSTPVGYPVAVGGWATSTTPCI